MAMQREIIAEFTGMEEDTESVIALVEQLLEEKQRFETLSEADRMDVTLF